MMECSMLVWWKVISWIVKEMDGKLADVIVETYLRFVMSRVLRLC